MKPKQAGTVVVDQPMPREHRRRRSLGRRSPINGRAGHLNLLHAAAFKLRGLLVVPLVAFALLWVKWEWEFGPAVWSLGLLLFAAGLGLRCWAQRHLQYRLRSGAERHLAVTGPFAYAAIRCTSEICFC